MKQSRFTDAQIIGLLRQTENCMPDQELCRLGGFSDAAFYKWRAKFGGSPRIRLPLRALRASSLELDQHRPLAHLEH